MADFYFDTDLNCEIIQKRVVRKYFTELEPGTSYKVTIKKGRRRSNRQNRYYWGVVMNLVLQGLRDAGFEKVRTEEDAHNVCKSLFLKDHEQHGDIKVEIIGHTRKLTTVEFEDYIQNITIWASDYLQISIPAPGEQSEFEF